MNWDVDIFSMTASASLTMALIYGFIWWRRRDEPANLLFALAALGTAALAWCDLALMHSESPERFASAIRWAQVSFCIVSLSLAGFVRLYLRAGRTWLLWAIIVLRAPSLLLNLFTGHNPNLHVVVEFRPSTFLGEAISIPARIVPNASIIVGQLSSWVLAIFVLDAAVSVWRRGDRRLAVTVGGTIAFFVLGAAGQVGLVYWGTLRPPATPSLFYLAIIVAMAYQLGEGILRAGQLARDLSASEQKIAFAADAANLGFWSREFTRNEIWVTDRWRSMFGFSKSEPLQFDDFLRRVHPEDREVMRRTLAKSTQGDGRYQVEYRVVRPDGQMRWVASEAYLELDGSGRPARIQGVALDITNRKQAELDAHAHRNEVTHLLRAASLGELSAALAHELSQPLTAILGNAEAAQIMLAEEDCDLEEIRDILRDIASDDKRAGEVIARLRTLLRKGEFQPEALEANDMIRDALKLMNYDLAAHGVQVVTELGVGLPMIRGDNVQLQQVLINLILNAVDAMSAQPQNARTLKLGTSRLADNRVGFSVADTGGGIASGNEEKIFEPYHTTKPLGLGLGLSLSRSIIAAHGGRLWAENPPAGGATFHFDIPEWTVERDPLGTPADPLFQHDMGENENSAAALGSIAP
jgi:two-component system, LuxR family, sensor kinase FixL